MRRFGQGAMHLSLIGFTCSCHFFTLIVSPKELEMTPLHNGPFVIGWIHFASVTLPVSF